MSKGYDKTVKRRAEQETKVRESRETRGELGTNTQIQ